MKKVRKLFVMVATCVVAVFGISAGQAEKTPAQAQDRPNIVFVMTDDMTENLLGAMPVVRTEIMSKGVTFRNAHVTQSLCCPSRATFLRGQYPHNHLVTSNFAPDGGEPRFRRLGHDQSTVATWLQSSGYRTAFVGKYMNLTEGSYVPPGWNGWWGRTGPPSERKMNVNGTVHTLPAGHMTDIYRDKAMGFLDRNTDQASDPPFMLFVWTNAPHMPVGYAPRHANLFENAKLPKPPSFNEADVSDKPQWVRDQPRFTSAQIQNLEEIHRGQLRSLKSVDEMLGDFLGLLRERGELNNTYIVFAADNGVHMGEHRWFHERGAKSTPYVEGAEIPMVVRGPGVPASILRDHLVTNNDLAPTFADIAGVDPADFVDGRSLKPILSNIPAPEWRAALLNERRLTQPDDLVVPNYGSVVTQDHTYVEYETGEKELYDRRVDPYQINSIHDTADMSTIESLKERLNELKACVGEACREAEGAAPSPPDIFAPPPPPNGPPSITQPNPRPGTKLKSRSARIAATVRDRETNLRKDNIALFLDGKRISGFSYNSRTDRLINQASNLSYGRHSVKIVVRDGGGKRTIRNWNFTLIRR